MSSRRRGALLTGLLLLIALPAQAEPRCPAGTAEKMFPLLDANRPIELQQKHAASKVPFGWYHGPFGEFTKGPFSTHPRHRYGDESKPLVHAMAVYCEDPNERIRGLFEVFSEDGAVVIAGMVGAKGAEGLWRWTTETGEKRVEGRFRDGVRHGRWTWYVDGVEVLDGAYEDGLPHGRWVHKAMDGTALGEDRLVRGKGKWTRWHYQIKERESVCWYDKDRIEGSCKTWKNGDPVMRFNCRNGLLHGEYEDYQWHGQQVDLRFDPPTNLQSKGRYDKGIPEGVWTWYLRMSPEADLKAVGICEDGETELKNWRLYRGGTSERQELPGSKFAKTAREICASQSRQRNICLLKDHHEPHLWDFSGVGNR